MFFIAAALFLPGCSAGEGELVLSDPATGEVYASYPAQEGDEFSVEFIHSVNKSPVRDYYQCRADGIWNTRCVYYGFGAGVEEILLEGETLSISDHTFRMGEETVSLRDLCGRSSKVLFTYQPG